MIVKFAPRIFPIVAVFLAMLGVQKAQASSILYAETTGSLSTNSGSVLPIPGLQIVLPALSANSKYALVILCIPNSYSRGPNFPGGYFAISANNVVLAPVAVYTADFATTPAAGRHPATLVVRVKLLRGTQQIVDGMWAGIRGSTVFMDSPSTLSAVVE